MSETDIDLIIGGPQGGGIDSAAQVVIRSFTIAGYEAYGLREYHSNIKGRHSYFHVRVKEVPVRSLRYPVDMLVCLDGETPFVHMNDVSKGSIVIYDSDFENTKLDQVVTMEPETNHHLKEKFQQLGIEPTVKNLMEYLRKKGVQIISISFRKLITDTLGQSKPPARYSNTLGASLSLALLGLPADIAKTGIASVFGRKKEVVEDNEKIVDAAYAYAKSVGLKIDDLKVREYKEKFMLTGNEAVGVGKVLGGLKLQTYYPITPAADESFFLEGHDYFEEAVTDQNEQLRKTGVVIVQAEDEISAIAMAISGAMTGARTATATSGPGFSLMAEALGYAGINEIPVVLTLYQRGGPSTGLPTRNSQADLLFAMNAGHGDFPRIVLSSGDAEEALMDAIKAFNYAERYQMPVIHIMDKVLANSFYVMDNVDRSKIKIDRWITDSKNNDEYMRFKFTETGISPMGFFGKQIFWLTGDEHNELGHITEDPETRDAMMEKRMKKLEVAEKEIPPEDKISVFGDKNSKKVIISWGSNKGPILDAMDKLEKEGIKFKFIYIKLFSPFPSDIISKELSGAEIIIDLENNYQAQAALILREFTGIKANKFILKYNGRHVTEDEVYNSIKEILNGKDKVVMTSGA